MSAFQRAFTSWPILEEALLLGLVANVDMALARHLLGGVQPAQQAAATFLCHLCLSARAGHLCVAVTAQGLCPALEDVWLTADTPAAMTLVLALTALASRGATELPDDLVAAGESAYAPLRPLVTWRGCYYLQCHWMAESRFVAAWHRHEQLAPALAVAAAPFAAALAVQQTAGRLLPEQAAASAKVVHRTLTLIAGGPGTGKTHTAGILLGALWRALTNEQRRQARFALAAPTGKAAAQLQHSLGRAATHEDFPPLTAATLHALLGLSQGRQRSSTTPLLPYDLLLVDESSMVDASLMEILLNALKPGARLILLGDHWQLPPVQAGAPFAELIRYRSQCKDVELQPALLQRCLRAELKEIVDFATAIRTGAVEQVLTALQTSGPLCWRQLPAASDYSAALDKLALLFAGSDPQSWRLLSPLRQGAWGVEALNANIHRRLQAQDHTRPIPILLTANNHHLQLYNGEVGLLYSDYALFTQRADGSVRRVPIALLPAYEYGYCLSVHKSQGSECDRVLIILPPGAHLMGRELLYTAVTRARHSLELWTDRDTLVKTLERPTLRLSNAAAWLQMLN